MTAVAIKLQGLTRYFGAKPVVRDLDFEVPLGQVTALLGLNGAGKTTTIRMLMGLLDPTRGSAITLGENASDGGLSTRTRRHIGYLVEGHFLYPSMRVDQCRDFQRAGHESWDSQLFHRIVDHFGIDQKADVGDLSRGQRAGVSLALVLAPDPDLLVMDDPSLGLDPVSRRALNETLVEFAGDGKRTVLLSTHMLDDVERIADRVAIMVGGRLKVDTSIDDFRSRVSFFVADHEAIDANAVAAVPGLIELRRLGGRMQFAIADADPAADQSLQDLLGSEVERIETTFSDSVLAYLARERADGSFFSEAFRRSRNREVAQ